MEEELKRKILDYKKNHGSTITFIATKLDINRATLSSFLSGNRNITKGALLRVIENVDKL